MGTPPLDLKVEQMGYGLRVPFTHPQKPETSMMAYRLNRDPPGMMRVLNNPDQRTFTVDQVLASYVKSSLLFSSATYQRVGERWHNHCSDGTLSRTELPPEYPLAVAFDALFNHGKSDGIPD